MKKREEADSGLRAGFVHEDEMKQKINPLVEDAEKIAKEENAEVSPEEDSKSPVEDAPSSTELEQPIDEGPQVSVKGVSGKMITGVIKAVKKHKEKKDKQTPKSNSENAQPVEAPIPEQVVEPVASGDKVEPVVSEEISVEAVAEKAPRAEVPAVEAKPQVSSTDKRPANAAAQEPTTHEQPAASQPASPVAKAESQFKAPKAETPQAEPPSEVPQPVTTKKQPPKMKIRPEEGKVASTKAEKSSVPKQPVVAQKEMQKASSKHTKASEPKQESRVKADQGITLSAKERLAKAGKTVIRPQSGNYVGRNSNKPAYEERQGSYRRRGKRDENFGRSSNAPSRGPARSDNRFQDKDKDEDETPRRSRSPRPKKRMNDMPDASVINKQKDVSRRNYRERSQRDKNSYGRNSSWRSKEELEFNEEAVRRARRRKQRTRNQVAPVKKQMQEVKLPSSMTVKDLAEMLKKTSAEVITKLIDFGVMATVNQEIDYDTGAIIAGEFGIKPSKKIEVSEEDILFDDSEDEEKDLENRPPVVVVMGHVDHGKTSILDWIRSSRVAAGEAGGITQHIGAYMVDVGDRKITFLDTPGHEAFTTIRARGAQVTDIAVLVVAADDGVMPQTVEAINHAKAAHTEIIVAINKIDKPSANIDRVKQELAAHDILDSDWGGTTTMVPVSAKTGENMEDLLEMILLTADVMELKANPHRQAKGTVIEASLDKNRGAIATLLVQRGTLHQGDTVVVGTMMGNVRAMFNDRHQAIDTAGPSVPVEIMGLPDVPEAGDIFYEVEDERLARSLVERRQAEEREKELSRTNKLSLENLFDQMSSGETKDLNIVLKADVQGSIQALATSLEKLSNEEVSVHIIHSGVGSINASDVRLADVSDAIIIGFNVRPTSQVRDLAKESHVEIRLYSVIYEAIEEVENALAGMLDPVYQEEVLGHAEIRETYKVSGVGTVAGCYVKDGLIRRNTGVRVVRDGIVLHEGKLASLRRFQDDVREVQEGYECGLSVERFNDLLVGDVIESYHMIETKKI